MWLFICLSRSAASLTADSNRWISAGISSGFSTRLGQISVVRCSITTACPMPTPPETPIPFIILLIALLLSLGWSGAFFLLVFFGFFISNNSAYLVNPELCGGLAISGVFGAVTGRSMVPPTPKGRSIDSHEPSRKQNCCHFGGKGAFLPFLSLRFRRLPSQRQF